MNPMMSDASSASGGWQPQNSANSSEAIAEHLRPSSSSEDAFNVFSPPPQAGQDGWATDGRDGGAAGVAGARAGSDAQTIVPCVRAATGRRRWG